jgi:hypothetical protein
VARGAPGKTEDASAGTGALSIYRQVRRKPEFWDSDKEWPPGASGGWFKRYAPSQAIELDDEAS